MKRILITDSSCDLNYDYIQQENIEVLPFSFQFKEDVYVDDLGQSFALHDFYEELKNGVMSQTTQINPYTFSETFRKYVSEGYEVIYLGLSSVLSGTFSSSNIAREEVLDEFKDAKIYIVDSRCASSGLGLLVHKTVELMKTDASTESIVAWLEENKLKVCHWFTVDSMDHLKRGGRITAAQAAIGSLLNIKPVMNLNDEGRLEAVNKIRGRKKSIRELVEQMKNAIVNPQEQTIFISHGDCIEDVNYLVEMIQSELTVKDIQINYIGPVVGTHSGPGTLAVFFFADHR